MLYLQHLSIPAYAMVSLMKSLTVKGFGIVNDRTDTYLILNVQSCRLQLEPSLDTMAPKMVSLVMQTLHKSTLDEASTIRLRNATCWQPAGHCGAGIQIPNLDPFSHLVLRKLAATASPKPKVRWDSGHLPILLLERAVAAGLSAALSAVRPQRVAMSLELSYIRGRAAGACHGPSSRPKFTGTINEDGRIRIDCENYPEHWQEIQLPEEWVLAYQAHQEDSSDRLLSAETLQTAVEVHADQAWTVDEADPGYAGLHRRLTTNNIDRACVCSATSRSRSRDRIPCVRHMTVPEHTLGARRAPARRPSQLQREERRVFAQSAATCFVDHVEESERRLLVA